MRVPKRETRTRSTDSECDGIQGVSLTAGKTVKTIRPDVTYNRHQC